MNTNTSSLPPPPTHPDVRSGTTAAPVHQSTAASSLSTGSHTTETTTADPVDGSTTRTTSTTTATSNPGQSVGSKLGEGVKGAWGMFNGAGEVIRGTINNTLDSTGDAIAERHTVASDKGQTSAAGQQEFRAGMDKFRS